jgi:predicted MPP superfamily phosphohydrolase
MTKNFYFSGHYLNHKKMKQLVFIIFAFFILQSCNNTTDVKKEENKFTFVFMTDMHVMPERNATKGFLQAIDTVNKISPDFVLTGGDNIMDALGQTYGRSDSLYNLYEEVIDKLEMPVYHTMGNHEVFGLYEKSGISSEHELYGKKMYENRLTERYYSFDHKNWHFIVLDGIGFTEERRYYGYVDSVQLNWLKADLEKAGREKPVAVSIHIPLLSVGQQIMNEPTAAFKKGSVITNAHDVIEILEQYNVKMVLQGHLHFLEDINYNGIRYITGGAVSSQWWNGPRYGMEEGFLKIDVSGENFSWEYVDFGWEVNNVNR